MQPIAQSTAPRLAVPLHALQYNDTAGVAASAVVATTEPIGGPNFTLQAGTAVSLGQGPALGSKRLPLYADWETDVATGAALLAVLCTSAACAASAGQGRPVGQAGGRYYQAYL